MLKIAVIEDERPVSRQLKEWIEKAIPGARVDQWFSKEEAKNAVAREKYDLITLDIELGAERNAGVNIIKEAGSVPVLVVSGMEANYYRGVMKALDAWDYLVKPVSEVDFIQTLLGIIELTKAQRHRTDLHLDPLNQVYPTWKGKRVMMAAGRQRLVHAIYERRHDDDPTVTYEELFEVAKVGKNRENIRKHVSEIKQALREVDPDFDNIVAEPLRGYRWVNRG